MKEGLFILALLIVSSYAIDSRHPGQSNEDSKIGLKPAAKAAAARTPMKFMARMQARLNEKHTIQQAQTQHAGAHVAAVVADALFTHANDTNTTDVLSSTGAAHVKKTPGASCDVYTTCVECTDSDSKAFYCMWSAARNVCQIDTDMDKIKRATPEDLWTKKCSIDVPDPIVDCQGCPINPLDKKPERDIVDSKIKGGSPNDAVTPNVVDSLKILGTDPNDPVTGPITHPNGTFGPTYLLPSIRDEDGNIKDPVQPADKFTYSPCVGNGDCASSSRFVSSTRKGKFAPQLLKTDEAASEQEQPRLQESRHVPHVDKVDMQDAQLDDAEESAPAVDADAVPAPKPAMVGDSELELSSAVVKDDAATPAAGGGFTPTFSDDDTPASKDDTTISTSPSSVAASASSPSSTDAPRFTQTKRSEYKGMSAEKKATQSKDSTVEVTEFDENVTGGKKINEDEDSKPVREEADDKQ